MKTCPYCWRDNEDAATACCDCHKPFAPSHPTTSSQPVQKAVHSRQPKAQTNERRRRPISTEDYDLAIELDKQHRGDSEIKAGLTYRGLNNQQAKEIINGIRRRKFPNSADRHAYRFALFGERVGIVSALAGTLLLALVFGLWFSAACATPEGRRKGIDLLKIWIVAVIVFAAIIASFAMVSRRF